MSCDTEHERKQQSKGKDENKGTRGRVREGDSAEGSSPTSRDGMPRDLPTHSANHCSPKANSCQLFSQIMLAIPFEG